MKRLLVLLLATLLLFGFVACDDNTPEPPAAEEPGTPIIPDTPDNPGDPDMPQPGVKKWDGTADKEWYDPQQNEFKLNSPSQLAGLALLVSEGNDFNGKKILLTADIDLNNFEWTPIGGTSRDTEQNISFFRGNFDGQGHKILNLKITQDENTDNSVSGFFGVIAEAEISNLTISSGNVTDAGDTAGGVVGAVIDEEGKASSITNCHNNASISGAQASAGIVGRAYGNGNITIRGCTNSGSISGERKVGGILAINTVVTNISDCSNSGEISGGFDGVGGIQGYANANIKITDSHNSGKVSGERFAGGIVGYTSGKEAMTDSYVMERVSNSGLVSGTSIVGGVVGLGADFSISDAANSGEVTSGDTAGGLAGSMIRIKLTNSKNTASIFGESRAGGIAGDLQGKNHVDSVSGGSSSITTGDNGYAGRLFGSLYNSPDKADASYLTVDDSNGDLYESDLGTIGIIGPNTAWGGLVIEGGTFHGIPSVGGGPGQLEFSEGANWDGYSLADGQRVYRLTKSNGKTNVSAQNWYSNTSS